MKLSFQIQRIYLLSYFSFLFHEFDKTRRVRITMCYLAVHFRRVVFSDSPREKEEKREQGER